MIRALSFLWTRIEAVHRDEGQEVGGCDIQQRVSRVNGSVTGRVNTATRRIRFDNELHGVRNDQVARDANQHSLS